MIKIDSFLNSITMYRLVYLGLIIIAMLAVVFGFLGLLPYSGLQFITTLILVLAACYITHKAFLNLFKSIVNSESYLITALILFLILAPVNDLQDILVTLAAGFIAMASKYLFTINKKHIFNPAAISVFILGFLGFGNAIWWVGSGILLPVVAVFGLLVVRKIRRFQLLFSFLIPAITTIILFNLRNGLEPAESFLQVFTSWPIVFFGTVMLTEPLTTPPRKNLYMIYGALTGVMFGSQFSIGPLFASPELALITGNIFSYLVSPKQKLFLTLVEKIKLAPNIYEFVFAKDKNFKHLAGQYLEWTMPDAKPDSRGNRRYFTIASSPTEEQLRLGVKIANDNGSSFKNKLVSFTKGSKIIAGQLAGDFTLPLEADKKLVLIAGGIGVTPFRSMLAYLIDVGNKRDIVLFYVCSDPAEFVYKDIFEKAGHILGIKIVYVITHAENAPSGWTGEKGRISPEMIKKYATDFKNRIYYLSGPNAMVEGYKKLLSDMKVPNSSIHKDYFPGF